MNCDVCQDNPTITVYLTQIVKGEMQKVNLCEACAKIKGLPIPLTALADALLGIDSDPNGLLHQCFSM